eukprot:COSAG01_NODE_3896_length_5572_cov_83.816405_4_plen_135_part_00
MMRNPFTLLADLMRTIVAIAVIVCWGLTTTARSSTTALGYVLAAAILRGVARPADTWLLPILHIYVGVADRVRLPAPFFLVFYLQVRNHLYFLWFVASAAVLAGTTLGACICAITLETEVMPLPPLMSGSSSAS